MSGGPCLSNKGELNVIVNKKVLFTKGAQINRIRWLSWWHFLVLCDSLPHSMLILSHHCFQSVFYSAFNFILCPFKVFVKITFINWSSLTFIYRKSGRKLTSGWHAICNTLVKHRTMSPVKWFLIKMFFWNDFHLGAYNITSFWRKEVSFLI